MAERDGVPVRDVLVADASRRTRAVNAYVSGLGPTRRIVVYDTLLREAPPAEVVSVVAHELGHAKDRDVLTGTLIGALGAAAAVVALYLLGSWGGLLRAAGVDSIAEPRAIALLVAVVTVAGLVAAPAQALRVPAGRGPRRRARAGADRRPGHFRGDAAPAGHGQPRPTPTRPAGSTSVRQRIRPRWSGWPRPGPTPAAARGEPHPAGHQRLPAPARRHPAVRAQPRGPPAGRLAGGLRLDLARARRSSTPSSRSRWSASDTGCCCRPRRSARRAAEIARAHGCDTVWFGAAAPLGLLAAGLRRAGRHRAGGGADPRPRGRLGGAARRARSAAAAHRPRRRRGHLPGRVHAGPARPGAARPDRPATGWRPASTSTRSTPASTARAVRARYGLARPAGGRLRVPAGAAQGPGHADPGAAGDPPPGARTPRCCWSAAGPYRPTLERLAREAGRRRRRGLHRLGAVGGAARRTTRPATSSRCRAAPAAGGLDVEGLGIVYLEASATGLPVVAGDSGGAPDAVLEGETGYVVDGRDVAALADRVATLLADPELAAPDGRGRAGLGRARVALGHPGRADARPAGGRVRPARVRRHAGCGIGRSVAAPGWGIGHRMTAAGVRIPPAERRLRRRGDHPPRGSPRDPIKLVGMAGWWSGPRRGTVVNVDSSAADRAARDGRRAGGRHRVRAVASPPRRAGARRGRRAGARGEDTAGPTLGVEPGHAGHAAAVLVGVLRAVPGHPAGARRDRRDCVTRASATSRSTRRATSTRSARSDIWKTPTTLIVDAEAARVVQPGHRRPRQGAPVVARQSRRC